MKFQKYSSGLLGHLFDRRNWPAWLMFVACLSLTLLSWYTANREVEKNAMQQFHLQVDDVIKSIESRLHQHEQILLGGAGLFDANKSVTREQWHAYVARLDLDNRYPGIQGVGFSQVIRPSALPLHIAAIRAEGYPKYVVRPPGERPLYTSIIYLEPFSGRNLAAFGFDMMSEPTRSKAMTLAVETGKTTISGKVKLVQETHGAAQAGFLMYVPIYSKSRPFATAEQRRDLIMGFVYSPFRVDDLMQGMMDLRGDWINFSIFDGEAESLNTRLFVSPGQARDQNDPAKYNALRRFAVYENIWTVNFHSSKAFEAANQSSLGIAILAMGGSISVLLFIITSMQIFRRDQAEKFAQQKIVEIMFKQDEIQESEQRFRFMLETCPTAARIARSGGHDVIFFNARYARLINAKKGQVKGVDPQSYYANAADYADILSKLGNGEQIFDRLVELNIPGEGTKWALASYLPIQYQGAPAVLGWFHDITERIRMERMKSEFISTVSHELRTPLTSISGALGLIAGGVLGVLPEKAGQMIDVAYRNSLLLTHLINDLLDMEKLVSGKMHFDLQRHEVITLLKQAVESNSAYKSDRRVKLSLTETVPEVEVTVDKQRFQQVMSNLLSNAINYSPDEGTVEVAVQKQNSVVRITVTDHGPGIPAEFRSRIFQKFSQADSSDTRQKGGTGLGLAITRELIEQMGGTIGFDSIEGQGSCFYIDLPIL